MAKSEKLVEASVDRAAETQTHEGDGRSPIGEATEIVSIQAGAVARGPSQEPRRPRAGTILGDYTLISSLGAGAMGEVWLARDAVLDREVAIKFLGARPRPEARLRFAMEARALARLRHPNVVVVHHAGEVDGHPYLVMERLRGRSLADTPTPLAIERVVDVGTSMARGLAAAHAAGVLHRDVKRANAMLCEDGTLKLVDFGLAKLDDRGGPDHVPDRAWLELDSLAPSSAAPPPEAELTGPTRAGTIMGTPRYLSPERWRGEEATARSDVFALGVVLYELAAGRPPVVASTMQQLRDGTLSGAWAPLLEVRAHVPRVLAQVIHDCLATEPSNRPLADDVRERLEALAHGGRPDLHGDPGGNPYRGLRAFDVEHHALFHGRETEARTVLEELRRRVVVTIVGPSGQGKSSVARAGVVPAIIDGSLGANVGVRVVVPGNDPCYALAAAVASLAGCAEADVHAQIRARPIDLASDLAARSVRAVLVVDQLEEVFTQCSSAERAAFGGALDALVCAGVLRILFTLRSDFIGRLEEAPELASLEPMRGAILLAPLSGDGLRRAVIEPARARGYRFEPPEVVERLVHAGEPGALPLLAFVLAELWTERDETNRVLRSDALDAAGGIAGALARHADGVLLGLAAAGRLDARLILLELVTPDGLRRRRTDGELARAVGEDDARALESMRAVLGALVRGRLVVAVGAEHGAVFELAHEALVRDWPTLRDWISESRATRVLVERLRDSAQEWDARGRPPGALLGPLQLAEFADVVARSTARDGSVHVAVSGRERAFFDTSRLAIRAARRRRLALRFGVPLLIFATFVATSVVLRFRAMRATRLLVASHLGEVDQHFAAGTALDVEAARARAFERYDANDWDGGEALWVTAMDRAAEQRARFASAAAALDRARAADPTDVRTRAREADLLLARLLAAERDHDQALFALLSPRLKFVDDGTRTALLAAPARLTIASAVGVELTVRAVKAGRDGQRRETEPRSVVAGEPVTLEQGSYVVSAAAPGRPVARYPVLLRRGDDVRIVVGFPPEVIPGFSFIPGGWTLVGAPDVEAIRQSVRAQPQHPVKVGDFLIARDEVTFAEYLEFLRDLPLSERALRLPHAPEVDLVWNDRAGIALTIGPSTARIGEPHCRPSRRGRACQDWLRMPVVGVSWDDAAAYTEWLARRRGVNGARLCTEREWERAARGADDRRFPGGDTLGAGDANVQDSWDDGNNDQMGVDEVGSYPNDVGPTGVRDLGGNAAEWVGDNVDSARKMRVARGGDWGDGAFLASRVDHRFTNDGRRRNFVGIRPCAPVSK